MKLVYPKLNISIELKSNVINNIVIENNKFFEESIIELNDDILGKSDNFSLSDNLESVEIEKEIAMINSPLDFKFEKREVNKRFHAYLKKELDESELAEEINEKYYEIKEIIKRINILSEFAIEYDELIMYENIFKQFDIHIKNPKGSFVEKFIDYVNVIYKLTGKRVFVLANCEAYIDSNELEYLRKHFEYNEIYILMLSNKVVELNSNMNTCIIDVDLCEIH